MLAQAGFKPRVSMGECSDKALSDGIDTGYPLSVVVKGEKLARGKYKRKHSDKAVQLVKDLHSRGVSAKVCPAIAGKAKCGSCTACADSGVQVIVYPKH